jgi:hypothetical protein
VTSRGRNRSWAALRHTLPWPKARHTASEAGPCEPGCRACERERVEIALCHQRHVARLLVCESKAPVDVP